MLGHPKVLWSTRHASLVLFIQVVLKEYVLFTLLPCSRYSIFQIAKFFVGLLK